MGKILFPKQHVPVSRGARASSRPRVDRQANHSQVSADRVSNDSAAHLLNVRLNGAVFVSTCPVCQQCFRSYVSMSQHCRTMHRLRPSDGAFSRYPGKFDTSSGPPLEASSVAAHVAHNLSNWLHGKKSHLLGPEQNCTSGQVADDADRTTGLASKADDKWLAEMPVPTAFDDHLMKIRADCVEAVTSSPACAAGPPVLMKMHDDPAVAAGCVPPLNDSPPVLQKCIEPAKPLTFYDEAGAWKFLCLVCYKVFIDKELLHAHQISSHPNVACTHLEIEAGHAPDVLLSLGKDGSSAARVQSSPTRRARRQTSAKVEPYTCVACKRKWRSMHLLHEHILACATSNPPAVPAAAQQQAPTTTRVRKVPEDLAAVAPAPPTNLVAVAADSSVWRYGNKRKRYLKRHLDL